MKASKIGIGLLFLTLFSVSVVFTVQGEQQGANINLHQSGILVTGIGNATYLQLRIVGPGGILVCDESSEGSAINWSVTGGLPDGQYTYEVLQGVAPKRKRETTQSNNISAAAAEAAAIKRDYPSSTQSGGFLLQGGGIVLPGAEETGAVEKRASGIKGVLAALGNFIVTPVYADQVILDDLIIDGSNCVGQDCVNGESFGFDTIRIKENNLRIRAVDTSNTSSFPTNDWQITFNDSANGGLNKFSIDDIDGGRTPFTIEAGAPSHSLYVDDGGRVGFGTSTPVVDLHVKSGNTPTLRLEQDGTSGFTPQTWDVAGNEAGFFVRDATNGSTLPFRIRPGASSSVIDISADNEVGINTTSPNATLHVVGNAIIDNDNSPQTRGDLLVVGKVRIGDDNDEFDNYVKTLHVEGDALISGNLELGSSRTLKNNIHPLDLMDAETTLAALQPVRFHYKSSPNEESIGFIAEDVPDLVATQSRKSISTMDVVAVLTKVVQEQQVTISRLENRITELGDRVSAQQ